MLYRMTAFHVSYLEIGKILFSSLAMGGGAVMVYNFMHTVMSNTMAVATAILAGIILYIVALGLTKTVPKEELLTLCQKLLRKGGSK